MFNRFVAPPNQPLNMNQPTMFNSLMQNVQLLSQIAGPTNPNDNYPPQHTLLLPNSIEWIKKNFVLIILQGLPGSGKSHLSRMLKSVYPTSELISIDDFFISKNVPKNYFTWINQQLNCALQNSKNTIIIDACNEEEAICQIYCEFASKNNFILLFTTSSTSWASDVNVCMNMTMRQYSLNEMKRISLKLSNSIAPAYFGWFLDYNLASSLHNAARHLWKTILSIKDNLTIFNKFYPENLMEDYYFNAKLDPLHVTAKFCGRIKDNYINHPEVSTSIGKTFLISVTAIVFSPKTCFALIILPPEILLTSNNNTFSLWQNDDNEMLSSSSASTSQQQPRPFGSRAHITLGLSKNAQAKMCGLEVLHLYDYINSEKTSKSLQVIFSDNSMTFIATEEGIVICQFHQPFICPTIFAARY